MMLSEKPWSVEAVVRLVIRVMICAFVGALVNSVIGFFRDPERTHTLVFLALAGGAFIFFLGALVLLGRRWRLETFARYSMLLLVCFYGGLLLAWWSMRWRSSPNEGQSVLSMFFAVLFFQGAALALTNGFLREHRVGWAEAFGFRWRPQRAVLVGLAAAVVALPIAWGLQFLIASVMEQMQLHPQEQQSVQVLRATSTWGPRIALGLGAIALAPVAEEILFRGILYPALKSWGHPRLAWLGTSLFFAAIHFNVVAFVPLTLLAILLVWLYEKTGNLLAPIAAHCLFNAANFAGLFLLQTVTTPFGRV